MEKRIALVTCNKYPDLTRSDRILADALRKLGAHIVAADWRDADIRWSDFDLAVVRSTWDYHLAPEAFALWIDSVDKATRLVNPARLMQWNSNKGRYLADLQGCGIRVLPFTHVDPGGEIPQRWLSQSAWNDVVVKPAIGASAWQILRVRAEHLEHSIAPQLRSTGFLIQPYAPEIEAGEYSVIFFGGKYSHTVLKKPRSGDFRTQPELGATQQVVEPPKSVVTEAAAVLTALPEQSTYARIDGIVQDGHFVLMEAELIEPELFFHLHPAATQTFAHCLLAQVLA